MTPEAHAPLTSEAVTSEAVTSEALTCWINARIAPMVDPSEWGLIEDGAIVTSGHQIVWVGRAGDLPAAFADARHVDLEGALVTPGLVDPHTHLVYGGDRIREHARRKEGVSYEAIAAEGGGIRTTVMATRAAPTRVLLDQALERARTLLKGGVTTVEIKSGYGLTFEDERRTLRVARWVGETLPMTVRTTFLGLHALPPEVAANEPESRAAFIDAVCSWLPRLHEEGLVDAVDAFAELVAFTPAECALLFQTAQGLGLPVKLHAEQRSNLGGTAMAAAFGALSCDHLEYLDDAGVQSLARAGTVAILLPGAFYMLQETRRPPVARLREAGVPIALATDHNPGTSPTLSLLLMAHMGSTLFGLTPLEALHAVTRTAARALGLHDRGILAPGARADFALWRVSHPEALIYWFGHDLCEGVVSAGVRVS